MHAGSASTTAAASYERGGLASLSEQHKCGPEPGQRALPGPVFAALQRRLQQQEGFSGYDEIQEWLAEEFGLEVPYKTVYTLVHYRLGAKLKVPRPEHPKA